MTGTAGRRRAVAVLAGAGVLAAVVPAAAARPAEADDAAALVLLADAAQASRTLSYSGTQYVATWSPSASSSTLVEVQHAAGGGVLVQGSATAGADVEEVVLRSGTFDDRLLDVLDDRYALRLAGEGRCTGRDARVVEALRPDSTGPSAVAGRFWVDRETGLLLRREVFDERGRRLSSTAFLDLVLSPPAPAAGVAVRQTSAEQGHRVPSSRLDRLRSEGWDVPPALPGGFALFDARSRDHDGAEVLHLSYSDGLSTTSLFSQPGALGSAPPEGFVPRTMADQPVWVDPGSPRRVVWPGGGRVWTLVSDAPDDAVALAVGTLPHEALPDTGEGWRARFTRGLTRLGEALNPFR